jgi:hypothetical protein
MTGRQPRRVVAQLLGQLLLPQQLRPRPRGSLNVLPPPVHRVVPVIRHRRAPVRDHALDDLFHHLRARTDISLATSVGHAGRSHKHAADALKSRIL